MKKLLSMFMGFLLCFSLTTKAVSYEEEKIAGMYDTLYQLAMLSPFQELEKKQLIAQLKPDVKSWIYELNMLYIMDQKMAMPQILQEKFDSLLGYTSQFLYYMLSVEDHYLDTADIQSFASCSDGLAMLLADRLNAMQGQLKARYRPVMK